MTLPAPTSPRSSRSGPLLALWLVTAPLVMLLLAVAFLLSSGELTGREGTYPRVLAVVVIALAGVSVVKDLTSGRRTFAAARTSSAAAGAGAPASDVDEEHDPEGQRGLGLAVRRVVGFFALALVCVWLMTWVGFFVAALLLVGAGVVVLGVRTPWKVAAYTAGVVGAAYVVFVEALQVPFPPAPWS
jgi:Flp pilus assembly protein TadB